jgi:ketosteroid isomerase-like protein
MGNRTLFGVSIASVLKAAFRVRSGLICKTALTPAFRQWFRASFSSFPRSYSIGRTRRLFRLLLPLATLFAMMTAPDAGCAQEIPLKRCDTLLLIQVATAGREAWFLVDTAATSMLNLGSFPQGARRDIRVTSWRGTLTTSAKEVTIAELVVGRTTLLGLTLPAIDLSAIGNACGQRIDGILGADLLGKIGATIDLKRDLLHVTTTEEVRDAELVSEMQRDTERCTKAFNDSNEEMFADCLDPKIALFTVNEELSGRGKVVGYFRDRYFHQAPPALLEIRERAFHTIGDAVWYEYEFTIETKRGRLHGRGMAMCRKSDGRWRIASMHHSLVRSEPADSPTASR